MAERKIEKVCREAGHAGGEGAACTAGQETGVTFVDQYAATPVRLWPRMSAWMSCVPS